MSITTPLSQKQSTEHFLLSLLLALLSCIASQSFAVVPQQQHTSKRNLMEKTKTTTTTTTTTEKATTTTTTSLHGWSVPSSVWAIEANPTARRIEYYDDVPAYDYSTPGADWSTPLSLDDDPSGLPEQQTRWFGRMKSWAVGSARPE